jgi:hypothetical protein
VDFVCYTDWEQLPESANKLFSEYSKHSIFFSRSWFENLVDTVLNEKQTMLLACVVDNDKVLSILPLIKSESEDLLPLTHLYSSLYSVLTARTNRHQIIQCLVQGLEQLPLNSLRLTPVAENDKSIQNMQQLMLTYGYECHRKFRFYNWIHRVQGESFNNYMAGRPAQVRNTIARKKRKLEREQDYTIRLFTDQNIDQALADYNTVYQASWKANEVFDSFIEGLAKKLSETGWLRLAILYINEQPAAAQFWFVVHGRASIFKLAYDESWKRYSPGSILISYLMQHVIDTDKVKEIDFLTGNDAYKRDWMSERRERWTIYCGKANEPGSRREQVLGHLKKWFRNND